MFDRIKIGRIKNLNLHMFDRIKIGRIKIFFETEKKEEHNNISLMERKPMG